MGTVIESHYNFFLWLRKLFYKILTIKKKKKIMDTIYKLIVNSVILMFVLNC